MALQLSGEIFNKEEYEAWIRSNPNQPRMFRVFHQGELWGMVKSTATNAVQDAIVMLNSLTDFQNIVISPNDIVVDDQFASNYRHM